MSMRLGVHALARSLPTSEQLVPLLFLDRRTSVPRYWVNHTFFTNWYGRPFNVPQNKTGQMNTVFYTTSNSIYAM